MSVVCEHQCGGLGPQDFVLNLFAPTNEDFARPSINLNDGILIATIEQNLHRHAKRVLLNHPHKVLLVIGHLDEHIALLITVLSQLMSYLAIN